MKMQFLEVIGVKKFLCQLRISAQGGAANLAMVD